MTGKRLLRLLPIPARDHLLAWLPAGSMERDFLLLRLPEQSVGAEIGVHEGDFSRRILRLVKPRRLHLIDPWKYEGGERYSRSLYGGRLGVDQAHMDGRFEAVERRFRRDVEAGRVSLCRRPSAEACATFDDGYFDWIYVDGNHQYEHVRRDLELYRRVLKTGGLMAGDDYGDGGWWEGGVKKAVDEAAATAEWDLVEIRSRQFLLRKRPGAPS